MLAQLSDRILVELFELAPFLLDQLFELLDTLSRVLLQARPGVVPLSQVGFEARHRTRMTFGRERPAADDLGAFLGQQREALFRGDVARRNLREMLQRARERGQPLFEIRNARIHVRTERHDTKTLGWLVRQMHDRSISSSPASNRLLWRLPDSDQSTS